LNFNRNVEFFALLDRGASLFRRLVAQVTADRAARVLWFVIAIVAAVKCILRPTLHSDFPIYWDTGRDWWTTGHVPVTNPFYLNFINHQMAPFLAEALAPFCLLPIGVGGVLWSVCGIAGLYFALTTGLRRLAPEWSDGQRAAVLLVTPLFGLNSLYNGQLNVPITACLLAGTALVVQHRWWLAGLLLAVPVHTKTYPIALGLVLSAMYPRRLLPAFIAGWLALAALPFMTHPADQVVERYGNWLHFLTSGENYALHQPFGFDLQDVRLLVSRWVTPVMPRDFVPIQIAAGGLVLTCALLRRRRSTNEVENIRYAYCLASMWLVLFGPCTQTPTYLLAGPAVGLVLMNAWRRGVNRGTWTMLVIAAVFAGPLQTTVLGMTIWSWVQDGRLGALGLFVIFSYEVAGCRRRMVASVALPAATLQRAA
jgi:hypothetical protein